MYLDRGRVERGRFDLDTHDLLDLQLFEHPVQNAILRPAIHPRVVRVPAPEALRKTPPFAALFGNAQHRVQHLQIAQANIATLHRQGVVYPLILCFRDLYSQT
jgi:hypothetical protein